MINITTWHCPKELIQQALTECPIEGSRTALNTSTGNFFYDPWKLKDEFRDTLWEKILGSLPFTIGEARVITLEPGQSYMAHADIDNRWHLNLSGQHSYLMDLNSRTMHKQHLDGQWRYMYADKIHTASNYGSVPRKQIVVRELLRHSIFTNLVNFEITPAYEQHDYRYYFDNIFSPWLNLKNKEGTLDNFVYKDTFVSFSLAEHVIEELQDLDLRRFNVKRG